MTPSHLKTLAQALIGAVGSAGVVSDVSGYSIDGIIPSLVVRPQTIQNLSDAMAVAAEFGAATAPWGGGTRVAVGNPIDRLDLVVDVSSLNRIVQHTPADLTVTVEAGIRLTHLQHKLREHNQFLALDPPLPDRATIGGTLATGVSGPMKWQAWSPRDIVIGMRLVHAGGTVTKSGGQVVKNVSGYDMSRLHIGGLGTLGIIAEVSFKLTPLPVDEATLLAIYGTSKECLEAALGVFHGDGVPLAMASFDRTSNERAQATALDGGRFLAIRLAGRPMALDRQTRDCALICRDKGASAVERLDDVSATALWRRVSDFGWDERTTPTVGCRASVLPSVMPGAVDSLERIGQANGLTPAILCHPAYGTVLAHWFSTGESASAEDATAVLSAARDAVHSSGGHMVIERCPPGAKEGLNVWDDMGDSLPIMRKMKEQYDPGRILNPGRFVGRI